MKIEAWRVVQLFDVNDKTSERQEIGGAVKELPICSVLGQLNLITITAVTAEEMKDELWDGHVIRLELADRAVYLEFTEMVAIAEIFNKAIAAGMENLRKANLREE